MRILLLILFLTCACFSLQAQVSIITTIAGQDTAGYCGDGKPATDAALNAPEFICLDKMGNVIISDDFNQRIRKISVSTGIIKTIAGTGTPGYNGDNIAATNAQILVPEAVCTDTAGNIYIADFGNQRIRKINAVTGIIITVAGNGSMGSLGDSEPATDAQLNNPVGICTDNSGNIYIGDYSNNKVRRVDATTGIITTFAGQQGPPSYSGGFVGYSGDGGLATNAVLSGPIQVYADSVGNVYICDQWNHAIRKVDIATNIITTIAGTGTAGYSGNGGLAIHAQLNQPAGMTMDGEGNIYIAEYGNGVIRKIDAATGVISTVAGDDTLGFAGDGGAATNAKLRCSDVRVNSYSTIYIADIDNNRIRKVYNPELSISTQSIVSNDVRVFPNPAVNAVTVAYHFDSNGKILIMDIMGREVISRTLSNAKQQAEIDVSGLASGLYLYRVLQSNILVSAGKLIKQ